MKNKYILLLIVAGLLGFGVYFLNQTVFRSSPPANQPEIIQLNNGDTYQLTADFVKKEIKGREYRMLAYNGSVPGPLIKVKQGSEITINFTNKTDIETTVHSHGVRLENTFDGTPPLTQEPIKPGESFVYKIKFPDAGMYWYHPHVREDYAQELGLYGNYLVVPANDDYWRPVNQEIPLFLDDILIENGQIRLSKQGTDRTLMGRYGNIMLMNGETDYVLDVKKGELIRFYVTNSANTRPFKFALNGLKMKLVGADGGAYEREEWKDEIILSPSERAIVEVLFNKPGSRAMLNKTPNGTYKLGQINISDEPVDTSYASIFNTLRTNADTVQSIDQFRPYFDKAPDKRISISVDMMGGMMSGMGRHMMPDGTIMEEPMMSGSPDGIEWEDDMAMMNAMSNTNLVKWKIVDQDTGRENMDIGWNFKKGDKIKIRILNDPNSAHPMQHPMHLHGQRFLVLAENGKKNTNLVWKDTVLVPAGHTVDILLDASNPGEWMVHCHIAEHLEAGMMFKFKVDK